MTKYFLVTGMDYGQEIEPYMVETFADFPYLSVNFGETVRYYEPISYEQVNENLKNGIELL